MTDATGKQEPGASRGAEDVPAASATAIFAARRAEMGLSVEDVVNQLKFTVRQIEALEAGDFDKLPGGTFARGMVRGYARLLKLDPAPVLDRLGASGAMLQAAPEQAVSLRTPIPFSEGGNHVNVVYAVLSVFILAAVVFFAFEWYQEKSGAGKLAFVPGAPEAQTPVAGPQTPLQPALQASAASPAPDTAARAEEKKLADLPPGKRRIVLKFDKESWVQIKAANGATLLSQINPAGSEKVVEGDPPFSLIIGNAASVHVTYNEKPVDLRPHFKVDVARLTLN